MKNLLLLLSLILSHDQKVKAASVLENNFALDPLIKFESGHTLLTLGSLKSSQLKHFHAEIKVPLMQNDSLVKVKEKFNPKSVKTKSIFVSQQIIDTTFKISDFLGVTKVFSLPQISQQKYNNSLSRNQNLIKVKILTSRHLRLNHECADLPISAQEIYELDKSSDSFESHVPKLPLKKEFPTRLLCLDCRPMLSLNQMVKIV